MIAKIIDNNTIHVYDLTQFDIDAILHSGQVFRYFKTEDGFDLIVGSNHTQVTQEHNRAIIKCNNAKFFYNYFDLDTDYNEMKKEFKRFKKLGNAITAGSGIRILRAEFVETVLSFIISANNNIKRFTKTLNLLAERYGNKLPNGQYAFPTLAQLGQGTEADFKAMGCGYRSAYLVHAIKQLQEVNLDEIKRLPNAELTKQLRQIKGVGQKVAFCVMLFCGDFHRYDTAPQDTWIRKSLEQLGEDKEAILNHRFAGVAQQYIFYYLQYLKKEL